MKFSKIRKWVNRLYKRKSCEIRKIGRVYIVKINDRIKRRCFTVYYEKGGERIIYYARFKIEVKLRRRLLSSEHVHHVDDNTLNDKYDNLKLLSNSEHLRITNLGRKCSKETKMKISKSKIGNKYRLGHRCTESHKNKISKSLLGRKLTQEHRKKLSMAREGRYFGKNHPFYGKHHNKISIGKIRKFMVGKRKVFINGKMTWKTIDEIGVA